MIRELDDNGWEVGLHGSYESYTDRERLRYEKTALEDILGHEIRGGRQHYLNLEVPETWKRHADVGLEYDTSLGFSSMYGFNHGYGVQRPFDDEFVVFPLTIMENALPDPKRNLEFAWAECKRVLEEAAENGAVTTILWHPNKFDEREYPNQRMLYRRIIGYATELDAWVGPPGQLYEKVADGPQRVTNPH